MNWSIIIFISSILGIIALCQESEKASKRDLACHSCLNVFSDIEGILRSKDGILYKMVKKFLKVVACEFIKPRYMCESMIEEAAPMTWPSMVHLLINPNKICTFYQICPKSVWKQEKLEDFASKILKDKPPQIFPTPTKRKVYTAAVIADVHMDLEYSEGSNSYCETPYCCHKEDGKPASPDKAAKYWGTKGKCDIPKRTVEELIKYISLNFKPDMLY